MNVQNYRRANKELSSAFTNQKILLLQKDILLVNARTNFNTHADQERTTALDVQSQTTGEERGINVIHVRMTTTPGAVDLSNLHEIDLAIELGHTRVAMEWISQFADPDSVPKGAHQVTVEPSFDQGVMVKPGAYVKRGGERSEELPVTLQLEAKTLQGFWLL